MHAPTLSPSRSRFPGLGALYPEHRRLRGAIRRGRPVQGLAAAGVSHQVAGQVGGRNLKTYHPETGRFGTEPWVCGDQNVILPLAAAWSIKDPANPYYHDKKLLAVIGKGGEALVDDQDKDGKWIFKKKDLSTWGMIYMPWTYSRWIRAYVLVKDALPKAQREKWEKGLLLGFNGIRQDEIQ